MSMGYGANFADTISKDNLAKVVNDTQLVNDFINRFNAYDFTDDENGDYNDLAGALCGENDGGPFNVIDGSRDCYIDLQDLWGKIATKFKDETGIDLYINYHSSDDEGDCYDEVEGLYFNFCVEDLYQPTKEYEAMMKKFGDGIVERQFFVTYG